MYLLVDQELGRWTLFGLAEGWERYQVAADGAYGEEISLPAPLSFSLTSATLATLEIKSAQLATGHEPIEPSAHSDRRTRVVGLRCRWHALLAAFSPLG